MQHHRGARAFGRVAAGIPFGILLLTTGCVPDWGLDAANTTGIEDPVMEARMHWNPEHYTPLLAAMSQASLLRFGYIYPGLFPADWRSGRNAQDTVLVDLDRLKF